MNAVRVAIRVIVEWKHEASSLVHAPVVYRTAEADIKFSE